MCGRLVLTSSYQEKIKAIFADCTAAEWLPPRYNITPAQRIPAFFDAGAKELHWPLWGFPPTQPGRPALINARSETVHQLPTFRDAFQARRCVVLADGFYEWHRHGRSRPQPYFFQLKDGAAFAMAGLWRPGKSDPHVVVLTTGANALMAPVHDRMPVIFTPENAHRWLDPANDGQNLRASLQPFPDRAMRCHPVSDRVNRAAAEGEDLIEPVTITEQSMLPL